MRPSSSARRPAALLVRAVLWPVAAVLAIEGLARLLPGAAATQEESSLYWLAGTRPAFVCAANGICGLDPGLEAIYGARELFAAVPAAGVYRIACVGDSTTEGWPYGPRGGYPAWLGEILRSALPGRRVEVLNLGIVSWDGPRLETVFDEALAWRPDAVVLRTGYDDYQTFLLRHPRGSAAAQRALLFLLERSAAVRRIERLVASTRRAGLVDPSLTLSRAEEDLLVAEHRSRWRRCIQKARASGVRLVALDMPWRRGARLGSSILRASEGQRRAAAEEARTAGLPFVSLAELGGERFVDSVHPDLEGYRLTAFSVALTLARAGLPEPRGRWRFDSVPPAAVLERRLALDEPEYLTRLETQMAVFLLVQGRRPRAAAHLEKALLVAPNADMVPAELESLQNAGVPGLYREVFARLRAAGRVPEPRLPGHRAYAGL